jgi:hypothetical protein
MSHCPMRLQLLHPLFFAPSAGKNRLPARGQPVFSPYTPEEVEFEHHRRIPREGRPPRPTHHLSHLPPPAPARRCKALHDLQLQLLTTVTRLLRPADVTLYLLVTPCARRYTKASTKRAFSLWIDAPCLNCGSTQQQSFRPIGHYILSKISPHLN